MFLIAGILLLSIIYLLTAQALHAGNGVPIKLLPDSRVQLTDNSCAGLTSDLSADEANAALRACVSHQREIALDNLLRRSLFALLGLSIIAFAFGYAMAGRVLSPLGRITRTARQVAGSTSRAVSSSTGPMTS